MSSGAADTEDEPAGPGQRDVATLYRREQSVLARFFRHYGAGHEEARDLVQEAFLRLLNLDRRGDRPIARPGAFLQTIASNLLRDRNRAARRHAAFDGRESDDRVDLLAHQEVLEARDSLARLEAIMQSMKPKTREIFMAHRLDGMSYAEIAAVTGMSVKGVERQMSLAIARIDRLMARRL